MTPHRFQAADERRKEALARHRRLQAAQKAAERDLVWGGDLTAVELVEKMARLKTDYYSRNPQS